MPAGNRKSRDAKKKQGRGRTTFATHGARPPSPNTSDYCPTMSDDLADESPSDVDSSDNRGWDNNAATSVAALQRLYSVFLPPHLWRNQGPCRGHLQLNQDTHLGKRQKIKNRPPIYTGESRMTAWRRGVVRTKAAHGCGTLDAFIQRKIGDLTCPQCEVVSYGQ